MFVRALWGAIAALILAAGVSSAEPPSREALDAYLEMRSSADVVRATCLRYADELTPSDEAYCAEEWAQEGPLTPGEAVDFHRNLVIALAEERAPADVIARFATYSDRSTSEAELIANLVIETAQELAACVRAGTASACAPSENTRLVGLILAATAIDRDGSLLTHIDGSLDLPTLLLPVIDELPSPLSPGVLRALSDSYNRSPDFRYIAMSTYGGEIDDAILQSAVKQEPRIIRSRDQLAYLDQLFDQLSADQQVSQSGLLITLLRIRVALNIGISDRALLLFDQLNETQRQEMWERASVSHLGASESQRSREQVHRLMVDLAAASIRAGNLPQGQRLLSQADRIAIFTEADARDAAAAAAQQVYPSLRERISLPGHERIAFFLREYMAPTLSSAEVYDVFITGSVGPGLVAGDRFHEFGSTAGWLWTLPRGTRDTQELAVQYLEDQGQGEMASYARGLTLNGQSRRELALELTSSRFAVALTTLGLPQDQRTPPTTSHRVRAERLTVFEEAPMPQQYHSGGGSRDHRPGMPPEGLSYPVEPWQIVRWDVEGESVRLIYQSTELDPAGEISGGGYWFAESRDGGASWEVPVYLGLQQYFPYVVLPHSPLPLVENGRLQIAVAVRELDPDSITFPPIRMTTLREEDGLYISAPMTALRRDQDGDGLTDLYEHRIGLDMLNPDTDGDGVSDALDGLPLTRFDPDGIERAELSRIMLEQVIGHDANALIMPLASETRSLADMIEATVSAAGAPIEHRSTLILRGDPSLFAGLDARLRILIYSDEMIERVSPDYGVFYPVGYSTILANQDQNQIYVIWSAGWVGGEFYVYKNALGDYEVEVVSSWIT